ncbi:MAG: ABC transporter permease [Ruminococcus sp.]|nr:ABC transporter permease [Ruminococcus sp.]
MKLSGVKYLANQGVENIWKNKMMAFATFCVLLISLLLVGCSALFYINTNSMILGLGNQNEIAVYLETGTSDQRVEEITAQLNGLENIKTVAFIPKEEAYARMKTQVVKGQEIFDLISDAEFMPDGFSLTVADVETIEDTTAVISQIADVRLAQCSIQVAEFLRELRRAITIIALAVIVALAAVSMIMISNTTKASVFARREEIQIMKYVGATDAFIRTPFFVEGLVTGFFSGAGAFFITWAVYRSVYNMFMSQGMLINVFGAGSLIPFADIRLYVGLAYLVAGSLAGAIGSVISTRKHLNV